MTPRALVVPPLVLALFLGPATLPGLARSRKGTDPVATSTVEGTVRDGSGQPLAKVTVLAQCLEDPGRTMKAVTDARGRYRLEGLRYGHWKLAFRRGDAAWPANRVLLVPPRKKVEANFTLGPALPEDEDLGLAPGKEVPLAGRVAAGVAHLEEKLGPSGWAWFRTGKGVAVLLGGSALLVAGVIALAEDDNEVIASPSKP